MGLDAIQGAPADPIRMTDDEPVRASDLIARLGSSLQLRQGVLSVKHGDHARDSKAGPKISDRSDGPHHGAWTSQTRGLDDDPFWRTLSRLKEARERLREIAQDGAAEAPIHELNEAPISSLHEESVHSQFAHFIDHDRAAARGASTQERVEEGRLPRAQEAREDGDRDPLVHSDSAHCGGLIDRMARRKLSDLAFDASGDGLIGR